MISELKTQIMEEIRNTVECSPLPEDRWTDMSFPELIKLMKFRVDRYSVGGFGKLMTMHTTISTWMLTLQRSAQRITKCLKQEIPFFISENLNSFPLLG